MKKAKATKYNSIMAIEDIAFKLNISPDTVRRDIKKAVKKLKALNNFELILSYIHGVAMEEKDLVQCGSVETQTDWIKKYGD